MKKSNKKAISRVDYITIKGKKYRVRFNFYNGVLEAQVENENDERLFFVEGAFNNGDMTLQVVGHDDKIDYYTK